MSRIRLGTVNDFKDKDSKTFALFGKKICVYCTDDERFVGVEMNCKHQGAELVKEKGKDTAICPLHNWQYDLLTGACLNHDSAKLRQYQLEVDNDVVYLIWQTE